MVYAQNVNNIMRNSRFDDEVGLPIKDLQDHAAPRVS
jgi:hypothetical protein